MVRRRTHCLCDGGGRWGERQGKGEEGRESDSHNVWFGKKWLRAKGLRANLDEGDKREAKGRRGKEERKRRYIESFFLFI